MLIVGLACIAAALAFGLCDLAGSLDIIGALTVMGMVGISFYVRDHLSRYRAARDASNNHSAE